MLEQSKIDMYIMTNQKYFPEGKIVYLKDKLRTMDDEKFSLISTIEMKDPTTILLVSIFLGALGIDRFMIGDTGMGIPPEAIDHVFERFFRVDKARSRQTGGNGLGLAIVRSIVENNDCKIHLESTLGKGTVFTVEIPRFETIQEER